MKNLKTALQILESRNITDAVITRSKAEVSIRPVYGLGRVFFNQMSKLATRVDWVETRPATRKTGARTMPAYVFAAK